MYADDGVGAEMMESVTSEGTSCSNQLTPPSIDLMINACGELRILRPAANAMPDAGERTRRSEYDESAPLDQVTGLHDWPRSVDRRSTAPTPAATAVVASRNATLRRSNDGFPDQEAPPFVVLKMTPVPTATPFCPSANATSLNCAPVPVGKRVHERPASVVRKMVPCEPTTTPCRASVKKIPVRVANGG